MYMAHDLYTELKDLKNITMIVFDKDIAHFWVGFKSSSRLINDNNVKGRIYLSNELPTAFCITEFDDFLKYLKGVKEPIIYDDKDLVVTTPNREFEFIVDALPPKDQWPTFPQMKNSDLLHDNLNLKINISYDLMKFDENGTYLISFMGHKKRINDNRHDIESEIKKESIDRLPKFTYNYRVTPEYLYLQYKEEIKPKSKTKEISEVQSRIKLEFYLASDMMIIDDFDDLF